MTKKQAGTAKQKAKPKKKEKKGQALLTIIDPACGRPPAYRKAMLPMIKKLVDLGATDAEIADFLNIAIRTFYKWKVKHPALGQALKDWKKAADERVERSLFQRAVGYTAEEDKIFHQDGQVVVVRTLKHYPPDPASCFGWLYNRQPERWRPKRDDEPTRGVEEVAQEIKAMVQDLDEGVPYALPPNGGEGAVQTEGSDS